MYVRCSVRDNLPPKLKSRYICVIECRKKIRSGNGERGAGFENVEKTADGTREGILNVPIVMYRSSRDNVGAEDIFLLQVRSALAKTSSAFTEKKIFNSDVGRRKYMIIPMYMIILQFNSASNL